MAKPIHFPQANIRVLPDPDFATIGLSIEEFPAARGNINNVPVTVTCWELTDEEIKEIRKTGMAWITTLGPQIVPMQLSGKHPFR